MLLRFITFYLYFLLSILICHGFQQNHQRWVKSKDGRDILIANYLFDENTQDFRRIIRDKLQLDPLKMPNINDTINAGFSTLALKLTDGYLLGVSNLVRSNDLTIDFQLYKPSIRGKFYIDELTGYFNYTISSFLLNDRGFMNVTIKNIAVTVEFEVVISTFQVINPVIKIDQCGDIIVETDNNSTVDWIRNILANSVIPSIKENIVKLTGITASKTAEKNLIPINRNMKNIIRDSILRAVKVHFHPRNKKFKS